jgi:hypothetical protein
MPDSGQHKNKKARSFVVEEQRNPSGDDIALRDFGLSLGLSPSPGWPTNSAVRDSEPDARAGKSGFIDAVWKKSLRAASD